MNGATKPRWAMIVEATWLLGSVIAPPVTVSAPMCCSGLPVPPMSAKTSAGQPVYCDATVSVPCGEEKIWFGVSPLAREFDVEPVTTAPARPAMKFECVCPSGIVKLPEPSVVVVPSDLPSAHTAIAVDGSHEICDADTAAPEYTSAQSS